MNKIKIEEIKSELLTFKWSEEDWIDLYVTLCRLKIRVIKREADRLEANVT